MKKLLSLLLALSMLLFTGALLASCGHKCELSADWSYDDTSHWHACTHEGCELVADKSDHVWDAGRITTKPTQDADGVKVFTCTHCAKTKTETVTFTGMTEEEWNAVFAESVFENFAYREDAVVSGKGISVSTETIYKFTKDDAWMKMTVAGESREDYAPGKEEARATRAQLLRSIKDLALYEKYAYDAEAKTYKAKSAVSIAAMNASTEDITLTFADGKLVEIKYTVSFAQSGAFMTADSTVTISDYGTVSLTPPAR